MVKIPKKQLVPSKVYMGLSENVVYPIVPNGFADHKIPFLNGYFIGKINPIFRHTHKPWKITIYSG